MKKVPYECSIEKRNAILQSIACHDVKAGGVSAPATLPKTISVDGSQLGYATMAAFDRLRVAALDRAFAAFENGASVADVRRIAATS